MVEQLNNLNDDVIGLALGGLVILAGFILALVGIIASTITKITQTKAREQSRREVAAYVAEGSITPDDAARLLTAGESIKDMLSRKFG